MRFAALVLALTVASGCMHWGRQVSSVPAVLAGNDPPSKVRVTMADGQRVVAYNPKVLRDSLRGVSDGPFAVPLTDVALLETRKIDGGKTAWLAVAMSVPVWILLLSQDSGCWPVCFEGEWWDQSR